MPEIDAVSLGPNSDKPMAQVAHEFNAMWDRLMEDAHLAHQRVQGSAARYEALRDLEVFSKTLDGTIHHAQGAALDAVLDVLRALKPNGDRAPD